MTNRSHRKSLLAQLLAVSICCSLSAPALATKDNDGIWAIFSTTDAFPSSDDNGRWLYWFDAQARYFDVGTGVNTYLVRPGLGYKLNDNVSAWAGYARLRSRNRSGTVVDENRYWQQLSWTAGRWHDGTLSMRTRLEQRSVSSGEDLRLVFRFLAKYVRPIGTDGRRYLSIGVEPFLDLNDTDWGGKSGPGQYRTSIGIGWRVSDKLSIEASYLNQLIWVDGGEDRVNHLGTLNFKVKL